MKEHRKKNSPDIIKCFLQDLTAGKDSLELLSFSDEPKAFNDFVARMRFKGFDAELINDRDQISLSIIDGSRYGVDFASLLEFIGAGATGEQYNRNLFQLSVREQIRIVLEDAESEADAVAAAITAPSFRERFETFLRKRSEKMFGSEHR